MTADNPTDDWPRTALTFERVSHVGWENLLSSDLNNFGIPMDW